MKEHVRIILTILIGVVTGTIAGATGIIASFIVMPAFFLLGVFNNYSTAVGTTLFAFLFPLSILAVLEYSKNKNIDYKVGIVLTISYFIFTYIGSKINLYLQTNNKQYILKYFTSILLIISGIFFGYKAHIDKKII